MGAQVKSMEIKKPQNTTVEQEKNSKRVLEYVTEVKSEVQKITWTSRDELIFYTKLVVGATFVFGMVIYLLDLTIQGVLSSLNYILHLIGG